MIRVTKLDWPPLRLRPILLVGALGFFAAKLAQGTSGSETLLQEILAADPQDKATLKCLKRRLIHFLRAPTTSKIENAGYQAYLDQHRLEGASSESLRSLPKGFSLGKGVTPLDALGSRIYHRVPLQKDFSSEQIHLFRYRDNWQHTWSTVVTEKKPKSNGQRLVPRINSYFSQQWVGTPEFEALDEKALDYMVQKKVLSREEAEETLGETRDHASDQVLYAQWLKTGADGQPERNSIFRQISGQRRIKNGKILEKRPLPWMKEIPRLGVQVDRAAEPYIFEWGRLYARDNPLALEQLIGLFAVAAAREVHAVGGPLDEAFVYALAPRPANARLYQRYGFIPYKNYLPEDAGIVLKAPLKTLIRSSQAFLEFVDLGSLPKGTPEEIERSTWAYWSALGELKSEWRWARNRTQMEEGALILRGRMARALVDAVAQKHALPSEALWSAVERRLPRATVGTKALRGDATAELFVGKLSRSDRPLESLRNRAAQVMRGQIFRAGELGISNFEKEIAATTFFISGTGIEADELETVGVNLVSPREEDVLFSLIPRLNEKGEVQYDPSWNTVRSLPLYAVKGETLLQWMKQRDPGAATLRRVTPPEDLL